MRGRFQAGKAKALGPGLGGVLPGCGLALDGRYALARSSCLLGGCSLAFGGGSLDGCGLGLGSDDDLPDGYRLALDGSCPAPCGLTRPFPNR